MYDSFGESTFQINDEEKQGLGQGAVVVKPLVTGIRTPRRSTPERPPFIEFICELLCTTFGHKWDDDFNCTRCHRELPIWRN